MNEQGDIPMRTRSQQREQRNNSKRPEKRSEKAVARRGKTKLNSLGYPWVESNNDLRWNNMFERLQKFREKHGHCCVPRTLKTDRPLGIWVRNQRRRHFLRLMRQDRFDKLEKIGFKWRVVSDQPCADHPTKSSNSHGGEEKGDISLSSVELSPEAMVSSEAGLLKQEAGPAISELKDTKLSESIKEEGLVVVSSHAIREVSALEPDMESALSSALLSAKKRVQASQAKALAKTIEQIDMTLSMASQDFRAASSTGRRSGRKSSPPAWDEKGKQPKPTSIASSDSTSLLPELQAGSRVAVYWPDDDEFYEGTVTETKNQKGQVFVEYDDGEREWVDIRKTKIALIGRGQAEQISLLARYSHVSGIMVGSRVSVWWPLEKQHFHGTIVKIADSERSAKPHFVEYDDGDSEWTNLNFRRFQHLASAEAEVLTVGSRVSVVRGEGDRAFCGATVVEIIKRGREHNTDPTFRPHYIKYDDGGTEWTNLFCRPFKSVQKQEQD